MLSARFVVALVIIAMLRARGNHGSITWYLPPSIIYLHPLLKKLFSNRVQDIANPFLLFTHGLSHGTDVVSRLGVVKK